MKRIFIKFVLLFAISPMAIIANNKTEKGIIKDNVLFAEKQLSNEIDIIERTRNQVLNPITLNSKGEVYYGGYSDWRSGFFPGTIWYLYELTQKECYKNYATRYTEALEKAKALTWHHDIGFIIMCSYGNALRLTNTQSYKDVIIEAARSLSSRFRPVPGVIQSWDATKGWQAQRGWECPVIIDNMMNLELLFKATQLSGDSTYWKIAVSHANRTLKEHFRKDASCYHVIDYDLTTGSVRHRQTAQGYSDESIWSRGQAWAIYGYAMCYRYTRDKQYLDQSIRTFKMMKNHKNMPKDLIPYWDMSAPKIPEEPRDVSSASCIASALYELCSLDSKNKKEYKTYADKILKSLSTDSYRAQLGANGNFLLMHSVGSIPHNSEIDVPLNYADYYFMEALKRKSDLEK